VVGTNGGKQAVDLTVQKLVDPRELCGLVMVVLADAPRAPPGSSRARSSRSDSLEPTRIAHLDRELRQAREDVRVARSEMQTSQEELKSTNEELQSTNEELQSSNEELTTSKEEMQSLNEELQTVNQELQGKVDELSRSNNDMKNLLNSTDIATLFLDNELNVGRFTTPTAKIIKLIPSDMGRPITDIATDLDYAGLADDAREVLRTLASKEIQAATRDGRWFSIRIMPYRTVENRISGVVITFTDVSAARGLEAGLREQTSQLRQMTESLPNLVWGCGPDGTCDYLSRQWAEYTGIPHVESLGHRWLDVVNPEERARVEERWKASVDAGARFEMEFRIRGADGRYRWFKARSVPIRDAQGAIVKWYGTNTDVDDLKQSEGELARSRDRLASVLEGLDAGFVTLDTGGIVMFANPAAERMLQRGHADVVGKPLLDAFPLLRGSVVEEKLHQAQRENGPPFFEARFALPHDAAQYSIRVRPISGDRDGISLYFEREASSRAPDRDYKAATEDGGSHPNTR